MSVPVEQVARKVSEMLLVSGPVSLSTLSRSVDGVSPNLVLVTVGWLLHMKCLVLSTDARGTQVMLSPSPEPVESPSPPLPVSGNHRSSPVSPFQSGVHAVSDPQWST